MKTGAKKVCRNSTSFVSSVTKASPLGPPSLLESKAQDSSMQVFEEVKVISPGPETDTLQGYPLILWKKVWQVVKDC